MTNDQDNIDNDALEILLASGVDIPTAIEAARIEPPAPAKPPQKPPRAGCLVALAVFVATIFATAAAWGQQVERRPIIVNGKQVGERDYFNTPSPTLHDPSVQRETYIDRNGDLEPSTIQHPEALPNLQFDAEYLGRPVRVVVP